MRPIFLLDLDGVVNCFPDDAPALRDAGALHTFEADGFPINVRYDVATWLRELELSNRVEFRWLTTWGHLANHAISPHLLLPDFKVEAEQPVPEPMKWWKLSAVESLFHAEPTRRVIWVDDEIKDYYEALTYVDAAHHHGDIKQFLALSPDEATGITLDDMMLIDRFIDL